MNELDEMTAILRKLGDTPKVASKVAEKAATRLDAALKKGATDGVSPSGAKWAPLKKGGRAYANVASKIQVAASGDLIRATLSGHEVFGQYGAGKNMPVRQILPDAGAELPKSVTDAMNAGAQDAWRELTK